MADAVIFDDGGSTRIKRVMNGDERSAAMDDAARSWTTSGTATGIDHTINDTLPA